MNQAPHSPFEVITSWRYNLPRRYPMNEIVADAGLVAKCGLYCGACKRHRKGKCAGCAENTKAGWCKIRSCTIERGYSSCADCTEFSDPADCPKFENWMSRIFALIFNSNRRACVMRIKEIGPQGYAEEMTAAGRQSLPRG